MATINRGKTIGCGTLLFLLQITFFEVAGGLLMFGVAKEQFAYSQASGVLLLLVINILLGVWACKFFKDKPTETNDNDSD